MELPVELQTIVALFIGYLVTEGLKVIGSWFGKDLGGLAAGITAGVVASAVVFFNGLLALVPVEYQPITTQLLGLVVVLVGMFGVHRQAKRIK